MNKGVAITGMAFLTVIILFGMEMRHEDEGAPVRTIGHDVAREEWGREPSDSLLARYPRSPVPRTYPGDWVRSEDYPGVALNNDLEGRLSFKVAVDPYGEVTDCTITRSSGFRAFDDRACAAISTRARFYPAFDENQQPVAGTYASSVRWVIAE